MWIGKEVQKMLRRLDRSEGSEGRGLHRRTGSAASAAGAIVLGLLFSTTAQAIIFPDQFGPFTKGEIELIQVPLADRPLMDEYGLQETEATDYSAETGDGFTVEGWRMRNSTGAMALFQTMRPADFRVSDLDELAVVANNVTLIAHGNHLFRFTGRTPTREELDELYFQLPLLDRSSLPTVVNYLPSDGLVPGTGRYLSGPEALDRFAPRIPPSAAAFSMSAEAELARYETPAGEMTLAVFQYPTPNIAREQQEEFLSLPNTLAKRSGPLVAVIVDPPDRDAAERLLARIEYQATIAWNEPVEADPAEQAVGWGTVIVNAFLAAGAIGLIAVLAGLGLGGFRALSKKLGWHTEYDAVTVLRIQDGTVTGAESGAPRTDTTPPTKP